MVERYFARIDENNIVIDVRVTSPEFMAENPERYPGTWIETFFDDPTKNYAGLGMKWNASSKNFEAANPTDETRPYEF